MTTSEAAALNVLEPAEFVDRMAPLFEGAPRFLSRLAAERPFDSLDTLFANARAIAHAMPEAEQLELIDAHPRLGDSPGTVSALSSAATKPEERSWIPR